jgi:hypothetical protein
MTLYPISQFYADSSRIVDDSVCEPDYSRALRLAAVSEDAETCVLEIDRYYVSELGLVSGLDPEEFRIFLVCGGDSQYGRLVYWTVDQDKTTQVSGRL